MKDKVLEKLREITNKRYVRLTDGGNSAIFIALFMAKHLGKKKVFIPDMGGWLTYKTYPEYLSLKIDLIKTNMGVIDKIKLEKNSILLVQNMPGYFAVQNMKILEEECKKTNSILINDVTADLRNSDGDIILGSFGKGKPVNVGYGGFIATNNKEIWKHDELFNLINVYEIYDKFLQKLNNFDMRLKKLKKKSMEIKKDLKDFEIIHKNHQGINVVVKFNNKKEKQALIDYCIKKKLEYTICPRYIRVNENAVSIEVKRL